MEVDLSRGGKSYRKKPVVGFHKGLFNSYQFRRLTERLWLLCSSPTVGFSGLQLLKGESLSTELREKLQLRGEGDYGLLGTLGHFCALGGSMLPAWLFFFSLMPINCMMIFLPPVELQKGYYIRSNHSM